jgi:2,5-diketo-D-gluconate reductase B
MDTTHIPRLGLGTWQLTGDAARTAVRTAIDLGYRHIDTAQMYGNETQVGQGIADSAVDRADLWLTTKLDNANHAPDAVTRSTEQSLTDLGVDHLDLLLIHWPVEFDQVDATLDAMQRLQERGLTRHIGVSNFTAEQLRRAAKTAPILTNQVEYHAMLDQTAVRDAVGEIGATLTAYSPLARGQLLDDPTVTRIARARQVGPAQVALRWLLDQPDVAVIPKASGPDHLRDNLAAESLPRLTEEERAALDALPKDRRVIDPPFGPDWD